MGVSSCATAYAQRQLLPLTLTKENFFREVKKMGRKVSKDKRLFVGNDMPPLCRTQPGKSYNYKDDEVLK